MACSCMQALSAKHDSRRSHSLLVYSLPRVISHALPHGWIPMRCFMGGFPCVVSWVDSHALYHGRIPVRCLMGGFPCVVSWVASHALYHGWIPVCCLMGGFPCVGTFPFLGHPLLLVCLPLVLASCDLSRATHTSSCALIAPCHGSWS